MSQKTIEDKYKKLSGREHILLRPGMYIGDVKKINEELWTINNTDKKMEKKIVEYSPGFLKIFDEVLTNATDHATRDQTVTIIKVDYNKNTGEISVYNNGAGIPVVIHKEQKIYVPELIFGHLLSGSNYNDNDKRTGSGTNGIGIKTCNIYSKKFIVETVDSDNQKKYIQEFSENMTEKTSPKITKNSTKSYTKITFLPDYPRFQMKSLEDDIILLINKRVYDCIACTNNTVQIYLNGEKLKGKGLQDYVKYFFNNEEKYKQFYETNEHKTLIWEYIIIPWEKYEHVSFVNGNSTYQGGKHVDCVVNQIVNKIKTQLETKKKLKDVKASMIKDKIFLFLRATVINPTFNSQTKECLTTQLKDFGCKIEVSDKFIEKIYKSSITSEIVDLCKLKETIALSKTTDGVKKNKIFVPKLEDANWAGTAKSNQCTLMLTEGDSAKTFCMWGRSVIKDGNEKYGIFPMKGKCNSWDTKIPLWNGEIKLAKDIKIGDQLIGDNGNIRNVITLYKGYGKMYEISQDRGESYKVNDEHILTLCIPEHKKIFFAHSTWNALYWDKNVKNVKLKTIHSCIKIQCNECGTTLLNKSLNRHYKRKHKNTKVEKSKTIIDMNDENINIARKKLEEFLTTIDSNNIIDISIKDYLKIKPSFQRKLKGIRGTCVNWENKEVLLDPYILGLWLGDGMKSGYSYSCHGEKDIEILEYLTKWGLNNDAKFTKVKSTQYSYSISSIENRGEMNCAPLKKMLSAYNLINNKHIPKEYLINSEEIRLKVLAGIIDSDGYICKDGTIEISQSTTHTQLANDIVYLSRSLGFFTHIKKKITNYKYKKTQESAEAYIIKISGDTEKIPNILLRKKSKSTNQYIMRNSTGIIKIKEIENENYVGIGIDDNSRFLINDFTVTHNCLNVRDATIQQLINNEELNNIKKIVGLKQGKEYLNTDDLRYGKIMLVTDADTDGSHIKSLFVNFIHAHYPSLIKLNFLQTLRTPIVKALKGKNILEFYTEQDYHKWENSTLNKNTYKIKYFKGLGTSQKDDAKELFKKLETLKIDYYYKNLKCDESILLAFDKDKNKEKKKLKDTDSDDSTIHFTKCTDKRKEWLSTYDKNSYIDISEKRVSYQDLIHKELIHFSIYDNTRSIPILCDGLKTSQRKILYYMLKKNIVNPIKVAQLSGYVSAETGYHHGEVSLQQAIINMAQDFIGSNNINLLVSDGNFGSRLISSDAASPRYIYTYLQNITKIIFNEYDSFLLKEQYDDGIQIEPEWFIPIIPMILVNGCSGIGTGFSTNIPCFNPKDIINNILLLLDSKKPIDMIPYYKNFKGSIVQLEPGSFISKGIYKKLNNTQIEITEIPIGSWVTNYKEFLESLIDGNDSKKSSVVLKNVVNKTLDENTGINFLVEFKDSKALDTLINDGKLEKELKLIKPFSTNNMYLFDDKMLPSKYDNAIDILLDFYNIRLSFYEKRKLYIIKKLTDELVVLKNKLKFITEYIDDIIVINKQSKINIVKQLITRNYHKIEDSFNYLINMPIISMTSEKIDELEKQINIKEKLLNDITNKTNKDLWKEDLDILQKML